MNRKSGSSSRLLKATIILLLLVLIMLAVPISLKANFIGGEGSLFTDTKAYRVGDLLTVIIFEDTKASNSNEMKTEENGDFSTRGGPGVGPLDFIPLFNVNAQNANKYDGKGSNSRKGSIKGRMTVEVIAQRRNGDLAIESSRILEINFEKEIMSLTGLVRRADINPDNTIYSYNIANAKRTYTGKGPSTQGSKPGLITRLLNWIF
ncbi:MAG: flagellar basal body L-ring protein FlgH [candidate division Zixibacteria bacterium]|nr:flagellar basal body L-ring protein FlgH [candidate division Zixibacteria bacterium]